MILVRGKLCWLLLLSGRISCILLNSELKTRFKIKYCFVGLGNEFCMSCQLRSKRHVSGIKSGADDSDIVSAKLRK